MGEVKRHPDWPAQKAVAIRTIFDDNDDSPCNSWLVSTPNSGTQYRTSAYVADWPDVDGDWPTGEEPAES